VCAVFIDAYDATTGERKWRFYTVPGPGEPGHETWEGDSWKVGGAPAWNTGTYDTATDQIFWPTGNPAPSNRGEGRAGDNLYSNSLLAPERRHRQNELVISSSLNTTSTTGTLRRSPVMIDAGGKHPGSRRPIANGFFYLLDRAKRETWFSATGLRQGKRGATPKTPTADPSARERSFSHTRRPTTVCPGRAGARPTSCLRPTTRRPALFYVTAPRSVRHLQARAPQPYEAGHAYYGSALFPSEEARPYLGFLKAIDPATGPGGSGSLSTLRQPGREVLSTAGGLVFSGDRRRQPNRLRRGNQASPLFGTFRWGGRRLRPRLWRSPWMARNTWRSQPAARVYAFGLP